LREFWTHVDIYSPGKKFHACLKRRRDPTGHFVVEIKN